MVLGKTCWLLGRVVSWIWPVNNVHYASEVRNDVEKMEIISLSRTRTWILYFGADKRFDVGKMRGSNDESKMLRNWRTISDRWSHWLPQCTDSGFGVRLTEPCVLIMSCLAYLTVSASEGRRRYYHNVRQAVWLTKLRADQGGAVESWKLQWGITHFVIM